MNPIDGRELAAVIGRGKGQVGKLPRAVITFPVQCPARMMPKRDRLAVPVADTNYETCEERLVLSASSLGQLVFEPLATVAAPAPQYGALLPDGGATRELTADLAYVKSRYGLTGAGQTVAIIDSGIAYDHVALGGGFGSGHRVVGGWDFTAENDADPYDDGPAGFHGTHVAGVLASTDATHPGIAPGVDLVALRVFDDQGVGRFEWLEAALQWVHEHRATFAHPITTINLSLGVNLQAGQAAPWEFLEDEFAQLHDDGIFIAVAAGNSFQQLESTELTYPASSQYVVPVASVAGNGQLSEFSQRSDRVLAASGERVTSTVPSHLFGGGPGPANDFAYAHGTSMATPYVAGASVLVREAMESVGYATIDQATIAEHLRSTSDPVFDIETQQTFQRINLRRAVDAILSDGGTSPAIIGSAGDDVFELQMGNRPRVSFGGHEMSLLSMHEVVIDASDGFDEITIYGSADDETLIARPDETTYTNGPWQVVLRGFESIEVQAGAGGHDVAHMYDSPGNDRYYGRPEYGQLTGVGFLYKAAGFDQVFAVAESGGADEAYLFDSSNNDRFYGRPQYAIMSGNGFYHRADGFSRVHAYATIGGSDHAELFDSTGNDRFHGRATSATLAGGGKQIRVDGFDRVEAYAVSGGIDTAHFYDSPGDDRFYFQPTFASMNGVGFFNYARGFHLVHAYSDYGRDTAVLYGSFRDDVFNSVGGRAELAAARSRAIVDRFESVKVFGEGGFDRAVFRNIGLGDTFYGNDTLATLTRMSQVRSPVREEIADFADVSLVDDLRLGDALHAEIEALDYVFRTADDDSLLDEFQP